MPNGRLLEEAGVQAVIKGLGSFKAGAGEMDRAIQGIGDSAGAAQKPVGGLKAHLDHMAESAGAATLAFGGLAAAGTALIAKTVLLAARNEELDIVLETVGKTAGWSMKQLKEEEERIKSLGITTQQSRQALILFMQGQLDIADAAKLARVAQDLAVIGMKDSSAAFTDLTEAILTQRSIRLREYGITLTLTQIYEQYAKEVLSAGAAVKTTTTDNTESMNMLGREMDLLRDKIQLNNEELALQIGYWGEDDVRVKKHRQSIEAMNIRLDKMTSKYNKLAGAHGQVIELKQDLVKELTDEQKKQAFLYAIMKEGEKVTGVYEAAMTKVGKQIRSLPRYFEELAFSIGEYFLEPLGIGITYLTAFLKYLTALPPEMKKTIASFVMVGTASAGAVAQLAAMFKIAPLLGGALSFLLSPLGLLAAAVGALAGAFIMDIGGIRTKAMPILETIGTIVRDRVLPIFEAIARAVKFLMTGDITNALTDFATVVGLAFGPETGRAFLDRLKEIQARIAEVIEQVRPYIDMAVVWFQEQIPLALEYLQGIWNEVWPQIQEIVFAVIGGVVDTISTAWTTIRQWTEENWPTIRAAIETVLDWVGSFVRLTIDNVVRIFGSAWKIIREWTEENWPLIQKTIQTVIEAILNIISHIASLITRFWEAWGEDLLGIAQTAWDIIRTAIETVIRAVLGIIKTVMLLIQGDWSAAWEEIKGVVSTIWEGIKEIISLAIDKIKELVPRMLRAGKDLMQGLLDGLKEKKDAILRWIGTLLSSIVSRIKDFFGFDSPSRLMAGFGRDIMAGFIQGLEQMRPALESQLQMTLAPMMQVAAPAAAASPVLVQGGHTYNFSLSASYAEVQSPASILDDLTALHMLAAVVP